MEKYVLIVAGGKGLRMGKELPKQFLLIGEKPVLMHTIEQFYRYDEAAVIILVLPEDHQAYWKSLCIQYNFTIPHQIVTGGETRFHSVKNGLGAVLNSTLVAVHDGVRPFVSQRVIATCFEEAAKTGAVIPVLPMTDSIRECIKNESHVVNRANYCTVQTPQVFRSDLLKSAYLQPFSGIFTDDASVVEAYGFSVSLIPGNPENIKITTPLDLLLGELLYSQFI